MGTGNLVLCWQSGTTVSVDTICSTGSEGGGVFRNRFSFLRCSHCLKKHTRITGVITRAIIRTAVMDIMTVPLDPAWEKHPAVTVSHHAVQRSTGCWREKKARLYS